MATALHAELGADDAVDAEAAPPAVQAPSDVAPRTARLAFGLAAICLLLVAVAVLSLAVGARPVAVDEIVRAFTDFDGSEGHLIVRELRVPRMLIGLMAGVCLGLSGAVMQGVSRNPLADPGILGVSAGASLAVVVAITVFGVASASGYVWFSFAGALVASLLVYGLGATGGSGATPVKLTLAGAALSAVLGAVTSGMIIVDDNALDRYRFWVAGSLTGRTNELVLQLAPFALVAVLIALVCGRSLNVLSMGDDVATSLGTRVGRARAGTAAAVVLTAGVAVAAAGPIGFVGLTVPHVARAITGPDHRWLLPYSAACGAVLVIAADVLGRVIARPGEVQVGIVTALLGAPVFVVLVRRAKLSEL
jgi:iron complex transport system permease protein